MDEYRNLNTPIIFLKELINGLDALGKLESLHLRTSSALTSFSPWLWTDHPEPSELEISLTIKNGHDRVSPHPALARCRVWGR